MATLLPSYAQKCFVGGGHVAWVVFAVINEPTACHKGSISLGAPRVSSRARAVILAIYCSCSVCWKASSIFL